MISPLAAFPKWMRALLAVLATALAAIATPVAWAVVVQVNGNFHEVIPGVLYRSGQLNEAALSKAVEKFHIRTIINLRGGSPKESWYRDEHLWTWAHAVKEKDFALSANSEPSQEQIEKLLSAMRLLPKPLLVHCKDGADRSGLAAALFVLDDAKSPAAEAAKQLSFTYGHFPWLGSSTAAMDRAYWSIAKKLAAS